VWQRNTNCVQIDEEGRKVMAAGRPQDLLKIYNMSPQKLGLIMLRIRKEIRSLIPDLSPAPGIVNALVEIEASGFRLGILTSNSRSNVNLFFKEQRDTPSV
jgi:phosphoglycolate phosphatase-like HAD superfamily hydrolase